MKESDLQIQGVDYLTILANQHKELFFFSIPNEGLMTALVAFGVAAKIRARIVNYFKKLGMCSGIPDFQIMYNKKTIFVEFKSTNVKANARQMIIHKKIRQAGFDTFIVDNFEVFKNLINYEFGI